MKAKLPVFALIAIMLGSNAVANFSKNLQMQAQGKLAKLEFSAHGRIGVFAINTANNNVIAYHAKERFPLCSTSKVMGVAAILKKSQSHPGLLQKKIIGAYMDHMMDT